MSKWVNATLPALDMAMGRNLAVIFFDEYNANDAVVKPSIPRVF